MKIHIAQISSVNFLMAIPSNNLSNGIISWEIKYQLVENDRYIE